MRTLGLLGGMSWESTVPYYRIINETIRARRGGLHSARLILHSFDFHDIERLQDEEDWTELGTRLAEAAAGLEAAGAEGLVICTNTMHRVADSIRQRIGIPILHIADATAQSIREQGISTVGLLGTRFTMEQRFYRGRLEDEFGLTVMTPNQGDRDDVHRVIYQELCRGTVREDSRDRFLQIIDRLVEQGASGIILGCTEIGLLVSSAHTSVPLFDTTRLHAEAAARWSVGEFGF